MACSRARVLRKAPRASRRVRRLVAPDRPHTLGSSPAARSASVRIPARCIRAPSGIARAFAAWQLARRVLLRGTRELSLSRDALVWFPTTPTLIRMALGSAGQLAASTGGGNAPGDARLGAVAIRLPSRRRG